MGDTGIEWTDAVWNPVRGCSRVSRGCGDSTGGGCYAERMAHRFSGPGMPYEGLTRETPDGPRWTGKITLVPEALDLPLRWKKPRRIFVNSMSDLFHPDVPDEFILRVLETIRLCHCPGYPAHVFQVLTKRPERMADSCRRLRFDAGDFEGRAGGLWLVNGPALGEVVRFDRSPVTPILHHLWLGVSVENQAAADERIPHLLAMPAAVRFVSVEPMLGPVDVRRWLYADTEPETDRVRTPRLDWVICGGESGPKARPCDAEWIRSIVAQCRAADVPAFVKQDSGPRPGRQGRIPDDLWALKEFPR